MVASEKQVTWGHNIVADGWAGAANSHPHPMPHPTPLPTPLPKQSHTQKASKMLVFPLFDSCTPTDRRTNATDGRTDGQSLL